MSESAVKPAPDDFRGLLAGAVKFHGHLCQGLVIGVKMAMAGLREIGISGPGCEAWPDLVIFSEIDRCPLDGIVSVTGRTPGKRSVKIVDYGKTAATFADAKTCRGVRVSLASGFKDAMRSLTAGKFSGMDEKSAGIAAVMEMPETGLFTIRRVGVEIRPLDRPGETLREAFCDACGEWIRDGREIEKNGRVLCVPCASGKAYYREI